MTKEIVFITNSHAAPGFKRLWKKATSLASDNDWRVSVICPFESNIEKEERRNKEKRLSRVNLIYYKKFVRKGTLISFLLGEFFDLLKVGFKFYRLSLKKNVEVVHLVNPTDNLGKLAILFKFLTGAKFIYDINSDCSARFKAERIKIRLKEKLILHILKKQEKKCLRWADLVIVPDSVTKNRILENLKRNRDKVVTIEPLPDLKDFYRPQISRDYKRGFPCMALYAGSLNIERGLVKLIRAIDFIVHTLGRRDILFVLAGTGRDAQKIKDYVNRRGVGENVHFTGWLTQNKLLDYMTTADLGLSPEPANGQKSSMRDYVLEFLAVGRPVVSFGFKTSESRIGKAGSFVADYNEFSYAKEIIRIVDNRDRSLAMGEAGRIRIARDLNWVKSEIKLMEVYRSLFYDRKVLGEKDLQKGLAS